MKEEIKAYKTECDENEKLLVSLMEATTLLNEFNNKYFNNNYGGLNMNEVHTINCIGELKKPNITEITRELKITKGAVTKITKKLEAHEYIISYRMIGNNKEKLFRLKQKGKGIFEEHARKHFEAIERDKQLFGKYNKVEKKIIQDFLATIIMDLEKKLLYKEI